MRPALRCLAAVVLLALLGCAKPDIFPADPNWKESVVSAMEATPGLASAKVGVNEVDDGLGHTGPVLIGGFVLAPSADPQTVVDATIANMCRVLGPGTRGIRVKLSFSADGTTPLDPKQYGFDGGGASDFCDGG